MPITTTEFDSFSKTAFFDSREWLNQENWQMYFGRALPTGVIVNGKLENDGVNYTSALARYVVNSSFIQFRSGDVIVNGIYGHYDGGYNIAAIKSSEVDRLFVARVYLVAGLVKIVALSHVAAEYGYTPEVFARMLLCNESLACVRNATYYDIPLLYEIAGSYVYDLRRLIYLPGHFPNVEISYNSGDISNTETIPGVMYGKGFMQVYGGSYYDLTFESGDTSTSFYVYPMPSCSEKQTIIRLSNNSDVAKEIRLPLLFKGMNYTYSWIENWNVDSNSRYTYKELVAGDKMTIILTQNQAAETFIYTVGSKGASSGIDPSDYFTKQEIAALLLLKANVSDVDDALALKANISDLGSLAYKDKASYVTDIENKPTLGTLAAKNQAVLTTDVTGILPISNGGTGAADLATLMANIVSSKSFWVDGVNGSDSNDGLTKSTPFKTIQKAIDNAGYLAETIVYVRGGTYTESLVIPNGKYIVIVDHPDYGNTVTFATAQSSDPAITVDGYLENRMVNFAFQAHQDYDLVVNKTGFFYQNYYSYKSGTVSAPPNFTSTGTVICYGGRIAISNGSIATLKCYGGIVNSGATITNKTAEYGGIISTGSQVLS